MAVYYWSVVVLKYGATIYRFGWRGQVSTLAAMRPIGVSNSCQYPTALPQNFNCDRMP